MNKVLVFVSAMLLAGSIFAAAKYNSILVTVTTAGTAVPLSATELYSSHILIQASTGNTNNIYVGGSDVDSTNGIALTPGSSISLGDLQRKDMNEAIDLRQVYVDADTNGNTVRVGYVSNRYKATEPTNQ